MSDIAIQVENISKRYRIGLEEEIPETLIGAIAGWIKSPLNNFRTLKSLSNFEDDREQADIIWALKDISFKVDIGEVIGVIGQNGAGKSTLLKVLSRITEPTDGRITLQGRVSSLLEVGTGFHPELTGRENIYLNGTVLGMSKKEIDRKFDEIVDFSGVERFIDTPVKRYSSGMQVRLAFSVAAHLEPEILLIDEVLAVGDIQFQQKCLGKMNSVAREGRTILFVSHNMTAVMQLCQRGIVINKGNIIFDGSMQTAVEKYQKTSIADNSQTGLVDSFPKRIGTGDIQFKEIEVLSDKGDNLIFAGEPVSVKMKFKTNNSFSASALKVIIEINDSYGNRLVTLINKFDATTSNSDAIVTNDTIIICKVPKLMLSTGTYNITFQVGLHKERCDRIENILSIKVQESNFYGAGPTLSKVKGLFLLEQSWAYHT